MAWRHVETIKDEESMMALDIKKNDLTPPRFSSELYLEADPGRTEYAIYGYRVLFRQFCNSREEAIDIAIENMKTMAKTSLDFAAALLIKQDTADLTVESDESPYEVGFLRHLKGE